MKLRLDQSEITLPVPAVGKHGETVDWVAALAAECELKTAPKRSIGFY
jgi:hypothetical protein